MKRKKKFGLHRKIYCLIILIGWSIWKTLIYTLYKLVHSIWKRIYMPYENLLLMTLWFTESIFMKIFHHLHCINCWKSFIFTDEPILMTRKFLRTSAPFYRWILHWTSWKQKKKSDTNNMIRWNAKQKPWRNPDLDISHVAIPMFYIWYLKNSITRQRNHCAWADYIPKIHTHRCTDKCTTYIHTYCTYHLYVRITLKYISPSLCHICAR